MKVNVCGRVILTGVAKFDNMFLIFAKQTVKHLIGKRLKQTWAKWWGERLDQMAILCTRDDLLVIHLVRRAE